MADKLQIGSVEISVARDSYWEGTPATHLRDLANNEIPIDQFDPVMRGADPTKVIPSRVLTFVVRSQGKTILLDAGVGGWGLWRFGDGHLLESLAAIDVRPEDVDFVVPTHLHIDHVGWNTRPTADGPVPTFTNARYLFQKLDWDYFTAPAFLNSERVDASQMIRNTVIPLESTGLMDLIDSERVITDEVTLLHTPGHTPGSVTILVQSGPEAALLIGDAAHHPAQLSETDWSPTADIDPSLSARSRKGLVEQAQRLDAWLAGAHFREPGPVFGRIVPIDGRTVWQGVSLG
jgi:glyoxylase-like metal-dependent hydrolase (beta-lactamase superfamily II)